MKNKEQILSELAQFYGTQAYHTFSSLFRNLVLTDGAKYLADACGCYWLFDIVGSLLVTDKKMVSYFKRQSPVVVRIKKNDKGGALVSIGSEKKPVYTQEIPYTDFPLNEYEFLVGDNGDCFVAMLWSEN